MSDRGEYRTLFVRLADDPDVHALSSDALKALVMLKLSLPSTGLGVIYPSKLGDQVGCDRPPRRGARRARARETRARSRVDRSRPKHRMDRERTGVRAGFDGGKLAKTRAVRAKSGNRSLG